MISNTEVVSVVVITFNSAETVVETLDSIKLQDYGSRNIDLIITDDASTDATVPVVNNWLSLQKDFFNSVVFLTHFNNGGIAKNCNHGWRAASTKWIKTIAGDDLLFEKCISTFMDFVLRQESEPACVFSYIQCFGARTNRLPVEDIKLLISGSSEQQFIHLMISNFVTAPSSFINKDALNNVGYANESYRMIEDYPLWLKFTENGYSIKFIDDVLVWYRIGNSVTNSSYHLLNEKFEVEFLESYCCAVSSCARNNAFVRMVFHDRVLFQKIRMLLYLRIFNNKHSHAPKLIYDILSLLSISANLLRLRCSSVVFFRKAYMKLINALCL